MAIPDYQSIMLPLLKHLCNGQEKSTAETFKALAFEFNLTEVEKKELLPSGQQPVFLNRIAWAKVYLKKAELIESIKRGFFKITDQGKNALKANPEKIDNEFLMQFKAFREFLKSKSKKSISATKKLSEADDLDLKKTPEEYIEF